MKQWDDLVVRRAVPADMEALMTLFAEARRSMGELEIDQWQDGYPQRALVEADIASGQGWVALREGALVGTSAVVYGPDPDYIKLHEGAWATPEPYAALHRFAVSDAARGSAGAGGQRVSVATAMLNRLLAGVKQNGVFAARVDTHRDNLRMRRFLEKNGFTQRGVIFLQYDGTERLVFDRTLE